VSGYQHAWVLMGEPGSPPIGRLIGGTPELERLAHLHAIRPRFDGEQVLQMIMARTGAIVVDDARTDPRTDKVLVEKLGFRTVISLPVNLGEQRLGRSARVR